MPISNRDIVAFVCDLAKEDGLKVTVSESMKGGLVAGSFTVLGGLAAGPVGLAFGGLIGGCVAAFCSQGFQSAAEVLASMPPTRRQELADRLSSIVRSINAADVVSLTLLVSGNTTLRREIMAIVINFIRNELQMQICE